MEKKKKKKKKKQKKKKKNDPNGSPFEPNAHNVSPQGGGVLRPFWIIYIAQKEKERGIVSK